MLKNFGLMPKALKWLTLYGLATALLPLVLMIPGGSAGSTGGAAWWSGSARWIVACSVLPTPMAAVLMLQRRRVGAWLFLVGWITANASPPLVALVRGSPTPLSIPSAVFTLVVLAALGVFLLVSKDVKEYFRGPEGQRDVPEVHNRDAPR